MKYTIRRYTYDDVTMLVALVKQFMQHRVNGQSNYFANLDFAENKVYDLLKSNISNPKFFCNVVEDEAGNLVGGMAGYIAEFVFSRDTVAKDYILFILPSVKSVKVVIRLVTTFVSWASRQGAKEVQLCNSTGFKQSQFAALAKLLKMEQFEVGFSRRF